MNAVSKSYGDAPVFIFCDHASNVIPDDLCCLGLPSDLLTSHIAWDIGAAAVSDAIAERLGARLFKCGFSRLVVDPNRAPDALDLIPAVSDRIPIPGNAAIDDEERAARLARFHAPYHDALGDALDQFTREHPQAFVVSIHSFTDRLMGAAEPRPWSAGLLWRDDEASAKAIRRELEAATDWLVGDNKPYDARVFNYSVDRHVAPRGVRHATIEIRQDLVSDPAGVARVGEILGRAIGAVAASG